ncbi:tropomyosin-2 [Leucoagaricus gongylophorus]
MDKIKEVSPSSLTSHTSLNYPQKLTSLRNDADNAIARAEDAEARNKKLEQELLEREQENTSLNHRLTRSDAEIDELETQIKDLKQKLTISSDATSTNEGLARKVQLLEEELDACEKNLRETTEKCVDWHLYSFLPTHLQVEAG